MAGEMGHQIKTLASEADDLNSVPRTNMVNSDLHAYAMAHVHSWYLNRPICSPWGQLDGTSVPAHP